MQDSGPNLAYSEALDAVLYITMFQPKSLECAELPRARAEFASFGQICTLKVASTPEGSGIVERKGVSVGSGVA